MFRWIIPFFFKVSKGQWRKQTRCLLFLSSSREICLFLPKALNIIFFPFPHSNTDRGEKKEASCLFPSLTRCTVIIFFSSLYPYGQPSITFALIICSFLLMKMRVTMCTVISRSQLTIWRICLLIFKEFGVGTWWTLS